MGEGYHPQFLGESAERGYRPFARFQHRWEALLVMAMIASRQEAAYRLQSLPDGRGYAVQSRAAKENPPPDLPRSLPPTPQGGRHHLPS